MHAEVGLAALQAMSLVDAGFHLDTSVDLFEWSRHAAAKARGGAHLREILDRRSGRSPRSPAWRSARGSTAGTSTGPGGDRPRHRLPADGPPSRRGAPGRAARPEVQLVYGLRGREPRRGAAPPAPRVGGHPAARRGGPRPARRPGSRPGPARGPAPPRPAATSTAGRLVEAEPALEDVERRSGDDRQRYLARLFLGRLAERRGRHDEAARLYARALEGWPDSQAARLALAHVLERSTGPAAALPLVAASLAASQRLDRATDPWWLYPFGPPGLAEAALDAIWTKALDR